MLLRFFWLRFQVIGLRIVNDMSYSRSTMHRLHNDEFQIQNPGFLSRPNFETNLAPRNLQADGNFNHFRDREAMELYSRARAQQEEIQSLREQIALACVKELELLSEKYALERKFSDLRMAVDEKQKEAISSALDELSRRKGYMDEHLKLANELKKLHDELQWKIRTSHILIVGFHTATSAGNILECPINIFLSLSRARAS